MSTYTTEVRYICETAAGLDSSTGFSSLNEVLTTAAPKVFDFDFPIFDEAYRLPLERKILKHYYTREIGEETVGLWKLRLDARLNEIMPYYNKLYESELLKFNPLYEVDYTKTGNRQGDTTNSEQSTVTTDNTALMTGTVGDSGTHTNTDQTTGTITDERETGSTDALTGTITDQGTSSSTATKTGTVKDERDISLTDKMTGTVKDEGSSDSTRTDDLEQGTTNTGSDSENGGTVNKNDHWDYYSDTPQGTVGNLRDLTYLTNARHITDDGTGSTTSKTTTYGKETNVTNTGTQTNNTTFDTTRTHNTTNTHSGSDDNLTTYNTTDGSQGSTGNTRTHNTLDTKAGTDDNTRTYNTTDTTNGTDSNTRTYNTTNKLDGEVSTIADKTINNLEEYTEHVSGKMSGGSYAKLLTEFRETFLNIDLMIINNLSDLFFGLW